MQALPICIHAWPPQALKKAGHLDVVIKLDPFHWFQRWDECFAVPEDHILRLTFTAQLRDAVFVADVSDYRQERDRLQRQSGEKPSHHSILGSIRRIIPQVRLVPSPGPVGVRASLMIPLSPSHIYSCTGYCKSFSGGSIGRPR